MDSHPPIRSLELAVSLTTPIVLLALILGKMLNQQLLELGTASEEVFRGDRLPLLEFPQPPEIE